MDLMALANEDDKSYNSTNIPPGGRKGQALVKASDKSYNIKWANAGTGGSGGSCGCEAMSITDIIKIMGGNKNG